jgi:hypothetical protein
MRAEGNSRSNDSVWLQYSDAIDARRRPLFRVGSSSGMPVALQECPSCGISGWGWADDGWWTGRAATIAFRSTGVKRLRIQTREDGAVIDQIVLSPQRYLSGRPAPVRTTGQSLTHEVEAIVSAPSGSRTVV